MPLSNQVPKLFVLKDLCALWVSEILINLSLAEKERLINYSALVIDMLIAGTTFFHIECLDLAMHYFCLVEI